MDNETSSTNVVHKPPPLDSDQLNYLIWRYLQEHGYADAAVKLQRDWNVNPEGLPFAKHIKGKALVNLVQKGLRYHHLSVTVDENGTPKPLLPSMFFFGPESAGEEDQSYEKEALLKDTDLTRAASPASSIANATRKLRETASVAMDEGTPQPAKRGRKPAQSLSADRNGVSARKVSTTTDPDAVNGHGPPRPDLASSSVGENNIDESAMVNGNHEDRMDMDNEQTTSAEPVDLLMADQAGEALPPLVPTLTRGESRAIQVAPAKVSNLVPSSAVLSLDSSQNVVKALWQPTDAATLIAQGDKFCGVWNLAGQDLHPDSVKPMPTSLFSSGDIGYVTAAAWNSNGGLFAVATFSEQEGQIHLFDGHELSLLESLPASQRAVTILRWNSSPFRLVGIAPVKEEDGSYLSSSTLLSWSLTQGSIISAPMSLQLPSTIFDITCGQSSGADEVYAAGEGAVYRCSGFPEVAIDQHWLSPGGHGRDNWTFIRCEKSSNANPAIIAAAENTASLWAPDRNLIQKHVHDDAITGLEIRPRRHPSNGAYRELEFATSSLDGTLKIWQMNQNSTGFACLHILQLEPTLPLMSVSYAPDGFCLAGVSYNIARIWNAEYNYNLMATWEGQEPEWRGSHIRDEDLASAGGRSSINGDGIPASPDHALAWHSDKVILITKIEIATNRASHRIIPETERNQEYPEFIVAYAEQINHPAGKHPNCCVEMLPLPGCSQLNASATLEERERYKRKARL